MSAASTPRPAGDAVAAAGNRGPGAGRLPAGRRTRRRRRTPATWISGGGLSTLVFALPMLVIFGVFAWWPILRSVVMSFQKTNLAGPAKWVGWHNFQWVLTDPDLPTAIRNTLYFALLALVIGYPVPLVTAVLISSVRRLRGLYSVLAYLPVVVPPVVAVLLWKFFYDGSRDGVFNTILGYVGLGPYSWLSSPSLAMPALVVEATWAAAGGTVIIYLAALIGVPDELYDAAEVDGAGIWQKVWHVTMPQLRGVLFITFILQIIGTVQVFVEPYLFTNGGPANATLTILLMIYKYAFGRSPGRQLRCGDGLVPDARRLPRDPVARLLQAHRRWSKS